MTVGTPRALCGAVLALAGMLWARPGIADDGRYQDFVVGAEALAYGGAYTAVSDDATGVFLNPAGIVDVDRANLSISASLYGLELSGQDVFSGAAVLARDGFSAADLIVVPSTTGGVTGLGAPMASGRFRHAFAFATAVPHYRARVTEVDASDAGTGARTRYRSALVDRTLHAGAAYAYRPSPWIRVGAALHYVLRTIDHDESLIATDSTSTTVATTTLRASNHALRGVLGLKLRFGPRWAAGLSLTTPAFGAYHDTRLRSTLLDARSPTAAFTAIEDVGLGAPSQQPAVLRVGVARIDPAAVSFAADLSVYGPNAYRWLDPTLAGADEGAGALGRVPLALSVTRRPVANLNAGIQARVAGDVSVSLGVFTNFSAAPELEAEAGALLADASASRLSSVHMFGGTASVAYRGAHGMSRLGLSVSTGQGKIVAPTDAGLLTEPSTPALQVVQGAQSYVYVFFASGLQYGGGGTDVDAL